MGWTATLAQNARFAVVAFLLTLVSIGSGAGCASSAVLDRSVQSASSTTATSVEPRSTTTTGAPTVVLGDGAPFGLAYPDLPGEFPSTLDVGDRVLHLKSVGADLGAAESVIEFWQQPATGRFRNAASVETGDLRVKSEWLQVFTGERLQGFSLRDGSLEGQASDLSYAAYQASAIENKIDPFAKDQGEIGERVAELRQAVENALLRETGREEAGGRQVIRYEGKLGEDHPFRRVVLADAATGFPLDDRMWREDGALYSCRLADLEVLDYPDPSALFHLTFPAGTKPMTDEQLPQMPERASGLEDCLRELRKLSGEVSFPLYWLGESAGALPLDMVEPGRAGERGAWDTVTLHYRDPAHPVLAYIGVGVASLSARPDLKKPIEGWKVVRTVTTAGHEDRIYSVPGSKDLFYVAVRGGVQIDLYGWSDSAPMTQAELIEVAKGLRPY
jgi:hypothetical protein